jgi:restriction system protein
MTVRILRAALGAVWWPFSRAAAQPGRSAGHARFDTRKWTPELLKHLEWRRFEELCAAYYEALGFGTRLTRSRPDGGIEIGLWAEGSGSAGFIVHCKPWDAYRVGINALRELHRAMAASGVRKGVLLTSGRFTHEAVNFAARESIELIDGAGLLGRLAQLEPEKSLALLRLATQGDFLTPTCPGCSVKMTSRKSTQGGRTFWGCLNYPRCKQTFYGSA